jgi:hypothetical protein
MIVRQITTSSGARYYTGDPIPEFRAPYQLIRLEVARTVFIDQGGEFAQAAAQIRQDEVDAAKFSVAHIVSVLEREVGE